MADPAMDPMVLQAIAAASGGMPGGSPPPPIPGAPMDPMAAMGGIPPDPSMMGADPMGGPMLPGLMPPQPIGIPGMPSTDPAAIAQLFQQDQMQLQAAQSQALALADQQLNMQNRDPFAAAGGTGGPFSGYAGPDPALGGADPMGGPSLPGLF